MRLLLLALPTAAASSSLVLVLPTPVAPLYGWGNDTAGTVAKAAAQLSGVSNVTVVAPPCSGCFNATHSPAEAAEAAEAAVWHDSALTAALEAVPHDIVLGLGVAVPPAVQSAVHARYVSLHPRAIDSASCEGSAGSAKCDVPAARAPYLSGALAALTALGSGGKLGVLLTSAGECGEDRQAVLSAFRQGAGDVDPQVCVMVRSVDMQDGWNSSERTSAVTAAAEDLLSAKADVIYSAAGAYDALVHAAVRTASGPHVNIWHLTGLCGGPYHGNARWLGGDFIHWWQLVTAVVAHASEGPAKLQDALRKHGDVTVPQWELPNNEPGSALATSASAQMKVGCRMNTTYGTVLHNLSTHTPSAAMSQATVSTTATIQCEEPVTSRLQESTAAAVGQCTSRKGTIRLVGVGVYVNALGNVDLKAGSLYADFSLYLHQAKRRYESMEEAEAQLRRCHDGTLCACPDFQANEWEPFANGTDLTKDFDSIITLITVDRFRSATPILRDTGTLDYYRVQGLHYFDPELENWPLDTQEINLAFEATSESVGELPTLRLCHMPHSSGLSPSARYFPGMSLREGQIPWTATLSTTCWPHNKHPDNYHGVDGGPCTPLEVSPYLGADETCTCLGGLSVSSRYTFTVYFERPKVASFLRSFLPVIFMIVVNQGVWYMHPSAYETRLGVCGSTLVSSVLYHVSLGANTPDAAVLTWADRFMVVVYVNILVTFFFVMVQTMLQQAHLLRSASYLFRLTRYVGLPCAVSTFAGPWLFASAEKVGLWVLGCFLVWSFALLVLVCVCSDRLSRGDLCGVARYLRRFEFQLLSDKE